MGTQKINDRVSVKDWGMVMHMALSKSHTLKEQGTLIAEGTELDGKTLVCETHTPVKGYMKYGKAVICWYLTEPFNGPIFKTVNELIDHYVPVNQQINLSIPQP